MIVSGSDISALYDITEEFRTLREHKQVKKNPEKPIGQHCHKPLVEWILHNDATQTDKYVAEAAQRG